MILCISPKLLSVFYKLSPRLQQMLSAYAVTPERDPESVSRTRARFMTELDTMFVDQTTSGGLTPWSVCFNQWKQRLAYAFTRRSLVYGMIAIIVLSVYLMGAVGITVQAAGSSLPGEALYPLKTTLEAVRAKLTTDSAVEAQLYLHFAGLRLGEMHYLIVHNRYNDLPEAADEYEKDIQGALTAIVTLSRRDPAQATALRRHTEVILQTYTVVLTQMLKLVPGENQLVIQHAISFSQTVVITDDEKEIVSPLPTPTSTPMPTALSPETTNGAVTPTVVPSNSSSDSTGAQNNADDGSHRDGSGSGADDSGHSEDADDDGGDDDD